MAEDRGADFYYSTPGVQLIKDSEGSVTGVVGQTSDGFELFNATKAVILATGDYQNNSSMVDRFSPTFPGSRESKSTKRATAF